MIEVLEVRAGGTAVVRTDGLCRVVGSGVVIGELLERDEAYSLAEFFDGSHVDEKASVVAYAELAQSSSSC